MIIKFVILSLLYSSVIATQDVLGVRHLVGEPDYRKVTLRWQAFARAGRELPQFQVRYCEFQSWGSQRCRTKDVDDPTWNDIYDSDNSKMFSVDVKELRMATTYSFEVKPVITGREDRADDRKHIIIVPTKGFSARATQCLPHSSEIEVSTGPHFAGRVTVEATDGDSCSVDGEPDSLRDTYVLHIDHKACGSQVNETTVATYVIVQENLSILTHSTRRFLVLCSYQPETLTIRAGLSLPSAHAHGHSQPVPEPQDSARRSRHLRQAKLEMIQTEKLNTDKVVMISFLIIIGVSCVLFLTYRWKSKRVVDNIDTLSIASSTNISTNTNETDSFANSIYDVSPLSSLNNIEIDVKIEIPSTNLNGETILKH